MVAARGKQKYSERTLPSATSSTANRIVERMLASAV
jgi:hypothetical protein